MPKTQAEIASRYQELRDAMETHRHAIEHLAIDLAHLQRSCTHPGKYQYTACGHPCERCPDCGWNI